MLYVATTMIESKGWIGISYEYEKICALKGLVVAIVLWVFRREYPPFATKGLLLATIAGGVGCVVWIALDQVQAAIPGMQAFLEILMHGGRTGYNPGASQAPPAWRIAFVGVRIIELAVIVPVMEEVFWRGFLARYLLADDFRHAPQGAFTPMSFTIVTLAFATVHPEFLAAIAWGAMINLLYRRTANLWACVVMHGVTNGMLAGYILATGTWRLW
jgi:CAAX prenyl protease-like protein